MDSIYSLIEATFYEMQAFRILDSTYSLIEATFYVMQAFSIALCPVLIILPDTIILYNNLTLLIVPFDAVQIYSKLSWCNAENNYT